ncbi:HNH endonuclease signature motif containing protein [Mycobacterium numidiamassiliense]|nr:HNH endonuclease signature motif containing protein [Mycobacterium numidiamassiliense]
MFESRSARPLPPETISRLEEVLERWRLREPTVESAAWMEQIATAVRIENRAVAAQLVAIGQLFAYRCASSSATDDWAVDTEAAVSAEVSAGLRISHGLAADRLRVARAMRERLPQTAEVFVAGDIDYHAFATIVSRTDLIVDTDALARTDELVAVNVVRWPSLTRGRLSGKIDGIVAHVDADAVRRRKERHVDREVWIGSDADGISQIMGSLFTVDAHALDTRLNALAATPCAHDPRTTEQRRADALGALAAGADRLGCRCGRADCAAGKRPAPSPVTIHVIATQDTLIGAATAPACEIRADGLITAELVAELAKSAKLVPLTHPGYAPPEQGYTPSKALADFVRARDLTCRWPGCDVPAFDCDIDHTIPHAQGGKTHAANLKCYCRTHHLTKTFWGWREQQLADGTLILTSPAGHTYVTVPGSALLFPSLCYAVGGMPAPATDPPQDYCAERSAMMPKRRRTRSQDRAYRVAAERRRNREAPPARTGPAPPSVLLEDPPPF